MESLFDLPHHTGKRGPEAMKTAGKAFDMHGVKR
jgi:hypothetical protein